MKTLFGAAFLVLLILKLTGAAELTWFAVFIPLLIHPGLLIAFILFLAILNAVWK